MKSPKTDDLIALICKAATEKYSSGPNGDRVRPGIQIAHIPAEGSDEVRAVSCAIFSGTVTEVGTKAFWYVALHRYPNPKSVVLDAMHRSEGAGPGRVVVHTAKHEDLDRAVQLLALQMLPVEAQAELAEAIRGVKP